MPPNVDCLTAQGGGSFIPIDITQWGGGLRWADPGDTLQNISPGPGLGMTIFLGGKESDGTRSMWWCPPGGGTACLGWGGQQRLYPYTTYGSNQNVEYRFSRDLFNGPLEINGVARADFKMHAGSGQCRLAPKSTPTPTPTPTPTSGGPPVPVNPGANFGTGNCNCQGDDLAPLGTGVSWLDPAAFSTYAATVCTAVSGPHVEKQPFFTTWTVNPLHPTLHSQALLSRNPGGSVIAVAPQASAPRTARCTAQNVANGQVPDIGAESLSCTGVQAHLSAGARTWITSGEVQQFYPGSQVRGTGLYCKGAAKSLRVAFNQASGELVNPGAYTVVVRVCYGTACYQIDPDEDGLAVSLMVAAATDG